MLPQDLTPLQGQREHSAFGADLAEHRTGATRAQIKGNPTQTPSVSPAAASWPLPASKAKLCHAASDRPIQISKQFSSRGLGTDRSEHSQEGGHSS